MGKAKTMKIVRIALICVFAAVFIVSAVMLASTLIEYRAAEQLYGNVQNDFMNEVIMGNSGEDAEQNTATDVWTRGPEGVDVTPPETQPSAPADTTAPGQTPNDTTSPITPNDSNVTTTAPKPVEPVYSERFINACKFINELKAVNPQVVGYIYIELSATDQSKNISYPLVQGNDDSYYVDHAYDNSELKAGAIFMDHKCWANLARNRVSLVYGHNMNNGAMFHNLKYLKQREYFENAKITVYTLDGIFSYQPFAIYNTVATGNYSHMFFQSDADYINFLNEAQRKSVFTHNLEFYSTDRILTLSTCLNTSPDARMAVHAVLIGISQ